MNKIWLTSTDGVSERREFRWVVWGDPKGCVLFDRSYSYRGYAILRAKRILESGEATSACVSTPRNGNFFTVHYGNGLSDFLLEVADRA